MSSENEGSDSHYKYKKDKIRASTSWCHTGLFLLPIIYSQKQGMESKLTSPSTSDGLRYQRSVPILVTGNKEFQIIFTPDTEKAEDQECGV